MDQHQIAIVQMSLFCLMMGCLLGFLLGAWRDDEVRGVDKKVKIAACNYEPDNLDFGPCTREAGHEGPCAHHFRKSSATPVTSTATMPMPHTYKTYLSEDAYRWRDNDGSHHLGRIIFVDKHTIEQYAGTDCCDLAISAHYGVQPLQALWEAKDKGMYNSILVQLTFGGVEFILLERLLRLPPRKD